MSHINQQQALVIVEHSSTQFNLYLSDVTGVYYSLSLPDIVNDGTAFDLELVSVVWRGSGEGVERGGCGEGVGREWRGEGVGRGGEGVGREWGGSGEDRG